VTPIINEVENNILPGIMDKYPGITYNHMGQKKDITPESVEVAVINHQIDRQLDEEIRKGESGE
ncbi:MAG: hypothetical protein ACOC90_03515, partial [Bacteroidota bacterium]